MRRFMFLFLCLFSLNTFASGKLSLQPMYYENLNETRAQIGLGVYEHLFSKVSYNMWSGYGIVPQYVGEDEYWITSKHALDVNLGLLTLSPGVQFNFSDKDKHVREVYSVKLTYQLW